MHHSYLSTIYISSHSSVLSVFHVVCLILRSVGSKNIVGGGVVAVVVASFAKAAHIFIARLSRAPLLTTQVRPASWLSLTTCKHGLNKQSLFDLISPSCFLKYAPPPSSPYHCLQNTGIHGCVHNVTFPLLLAHKRNPSRYYLRTPPPTHPHLPSSAGMLQQIKQHFICLIRRRE